MSREVRRVALDWKHPVKPHEPYQPEWLVRLIGTHPPSRLHGPREAFVSLYGESYTPARQQWEAEKAQWEAGTHEHLVWSLKYHSSDGWVNHEGVREFLPYEVWDEDGETVVREFYPATAAEIVAVYPYTEYATEPTPETHMPDFDVPEDQLGWCLYETVSEGTPTTPVFATAAELINHLATVGEDYDQQPYRRSAAEQLVGDGSSMASMIRTADGQVLNSGRDADKIATRL